MDNSPGQYLLSGSLLPRKKQTNKQVSSGSTTISDWVSRWLIPKVGDYSYCEINYNHRVLRVGCDTMISNKVLGVWCTAMRAPYKIFIMCTVNYIYILFNYININFKFKLYDLV